MKAMTGIALVAAILAVSARAEPAFPDAAASDPVKRGWMQGSPPPPEKRIAFDDYSFFTLKLRKATGSL